MAILYIKNSKLDDESGTGVSVDTREQNDWLKFDTDNLGYMAEEITKEEYDIWKARIANPDMVTYFPGIFPGIGVVNKTIYDKIQARVAEMRKQGQTLTPGQAHAWLIENDLDEKVEACIDDCKCAKTPEEVKHGKLLKNLYDYADAWKYACPTCTDLLERAGIDKDKFFSEASKL